MCIVNVLAKEFTIDLKNDLKLDDFLKRRGTIFWAMKIQEIVKFSSFYSLSLDIQNEKEIVHQVLRSHK